MRVHLNGKDYDLKPGSGVTRQPIIEFPGNVRETGQQSRQDQNLMSSWEFSNFAFGSGIERLDIDQDRDKASYWRSTVDTRWRGKVCLPPLVRDTTVGSSSVGTIYSWGRMIEDTNTPQLVVYVPSAANRCAYGFAEFRRSPDPHFAYGAPIVPDGSTYDIHRLYMAGYDPDEQAYYYMVGRASAGDGGIMRKALSAAAHPTMSTVCRSSTPSTSRYSCSPFYKHIGTMHIGAVDTILHKSFVHPIMTGTYESQTEYFQHENYIPPYLAHTPDGLFAGASRGVFLLNLEQKTYTEKIDLSDNSPGWSNSLDMSAWGNEYLMVPYRNPRGQGGMLAYNTVNNLSIRVGMDIDDGVPSGWTPEVAAMAVTPDFIFAATARPLASYAPTGYAFLRDGVCRLLAYDGYGWHYMADMTGTGGNDDISQIILSAHGDGIPKLFMVPTGAGTGFASFTPAFIDYPLSNPLEQAGYQFATQGKLRLPIFNGGMPEYQGSFLDFVVEASNLGSGRQIELFYGLNGAEPTQSFGIATQSGTRVLQFASGQGVEAYSIQLEAVFTRGADQYETPVLIAHHSPVLHYMKFPGKRDSFQFTISALETKKAGDQRPSKQLLDDLYTVKDSRTQVPFWYGQVATKNVKMVGMTSREFSVDTEFTKDAEAEIEVVLAELI